MEIQKRDIDNFKPYQELIEQISRRYVEGQAQAARSINSTRADLQSVCIIV
jgi:hypothetical protein